MANHKSAIKRAKQSERRRLRNKVNRTRIKHTVKVTRNAAENNPEQATAELKNAMKVIDRAATKGTLHKKTASRKIARLSKLIHKAQTSASA